MLHSELLLQRFRTMQANTSIRVGDIGFGSGLSFITTWQLFEQAAPLDTSLDFFSIEQCPPSATELDNALAQHPTLHSYSQQLIQRWHRRVPGWNRWHFAGGRVRLTLLITATESATPQSGDAIDMWLTPPCPPQPEPELAHTYIPRMSQRKVATALVIGGGLAGCTSAYALAQRGIHVTLVDRAPVLASAASGNPRGILHARFGAGMTTLHQFVLAAYGHALALLDEVVPIDGVSRAECGLLQLATPESEAKRIGKLSALNWPPHIFQAVDAVRASELVGMPMRQGGLWFPAGGWVVPPHVCARLAAHLNITQHLSREVTALTRTASGWRASGDGFALEAGQVVMCCGHQARAISQFAHFPLQAVRGQISELPSTRLSASLRAVVCAAGYCTPAVTGVHVAGATTSFDDEKSDIREMDHRGNALQIATHMPTLHQALGTIDIANIGGRAGVRCSAPGSMPLVGEVEPGLYCSLAHGTRGLLTAGISGEVIAAAMCAQLPPLPSNILAALSPQRLTAQVALSGNSPST